MKQKGNLVTPPAGHQLPDLFSPLLQHPPPAMFDLASPVFLAEFYTLTIRRSRPRYLLRGAGGREKRNPLWCGAPGRKRGRRVRGAWGFSSPDTHFSFLHAFLFFLFFFLFVLGLSVDISRRPREGRGGNTAFLIWKKQAAARVPVSSPSSGPESGPLSSPAPSRSFCL